ncbi:hypothetical protein FJT64_013756 [Amphibalanus amphitrite]|uniref:Uncharacterized protein n=1 Tax=Amphibalanus amphitrite TaxID=1232801 RepID=A0A6A4VBY5_AMPAM|nr:hypothetical protein FJT64_013756 [Amphibalanus amphitrite]
MCVFLCWKSRVAFGWRLDCALGEWITMGGNRKTEESEALDEPVSCRAEDAASEDRQFRLVNLAALTPSSWPTGECLHSSSLAPPLRARVPDGSRPAGQPRTSQHL